LDAAVAAGGPALDIVGGFVDRALDSEAPEIAALGEIDYLRPEQRDQVTRHLSSLTGRLRDVLRDGARVGEARDCDFEIAANAIVGTIQWVQLSPRWSVDVDPVSRERLRDAVRSMLTEGLAQGRPRTPCTIDLSPLEPRVFGAFERAPLADAKRESILAAASRLFNLKGVDVVSLDEIAAALGATKRTVYHHVGDKPALIAACYLRAFRIFLFIIGAARAFRGARADALAAAIEATVIANLAPALSPLLPSAGMEAVRTEDRSEVAARSLEMNRAYVELFAEGVRDGSLRPVDLDATLLSLPGPVVWAAKGGVDIPEARRARLAGEIAALVCVGLKPT
jgi:AcrR family transcriptional regulator